MGADGYSIPTLGGAPRKKLRKKDYERRIQDKTVCPKWWKFGDPFDSRYYERPLPFPEEVINAARRETRHYVVFPDFVFPDQKLRPVVLDLLGNAVYKIKYQDLRKVLNM